MAKANYSVSVTFNAPSLDKDRLRFVLSKEFYANDVRIVAEREGGPPLAFAHGLQSNSSDEVMSVANSKKVFRWRDISHLRKARTGLERALSTGNLIKVQHGVFAIPGTENLDRMIDSLGPYQTRLGPGQQLIFDHLAQPKTAPELKELTGVTRQAVDQGLKKLMKRGIVKRINATAECAEWLYVRSNVQIVTALMQRSPRLGQVERQVLNLLPPNAAITLKSLRERIPTSPPVVNKLILKRLVHQAGLQQHKIVRLTSLGREHKLYDPSAEHLVPATDEGLMNQDHLRLLLALEVLEEARAIDLTAAAKIVPINRVGTGQHLSRLCEQGLVKQIKHPKVAPTYRLTPGGNELVAEAHRMGHYTIKIDAERAIEQAKNSRSKAATNRFFDGGVKGRTGDILQALASNGGALRADALHSKLPRPFAHWHSINLALRDLGKRGWVTFSEDRTFGEKLWSITEKGRDAVQL